MEILEIIPPINFKHMECIVTKESLQQMYPRCYEIPIIIVLSFISLVLGLFLPVITLKEMVLWKHTFSVLTGITSLISEGYYLLGLVIFLFSVIFPLVKLITLLLIWYGELADKQRTSYLQWLGILGKWSMLDVFVVAITIVIAKISHFASAEARLGLYFFASAILMSMLITMRIESILKK